MKIVKKSTLFCSTIFAAVTVTSASSADSHTETFDIQDQNKTSSIPAKLQYQKMIAWAFASVKNTHELAGELAKEDSPLNKFSEGAKARFVESIVFRRNGLGGFYYGDLEDELTPTEIYNVLSLFGAQDIVSHFTGARIVTSSDLLLMSPPNYIDNNDGELYGYYGPTGPDYMGYKCISRATCSIAERMICMSNC